MTAGIADIVIVGAGPVGTMLSAELARFGIDAVSLEQRAEPGAGTRAVGVHAVALSAMEASGATDLLLAQARRVRIGEARRGGRSLGLVRFDRLHTRHPYVATIPQPATEAALTATAERWGAEPPRRGIRVSTLRPRGDRVEVRVGDDRAGDDGDEAIAARIVVVAGGIRSRALLPDALPLRMRRYPDRYLMTDCADTGDDGDRAVVHLDRDGVLESFPLPAGRRRYVAWMAAAGDEAAPAHRLRDAVAARTGSDAAAAAVVAATSFGVARSQFATMRSGRVFAIGDAAHEVSPIGGQGMNLGLIDAVTLAPLLARWVQSERRGESEPTPALTAWESARVRAANGAGRIAAVNTVLGRPAHAAGAVGVRWALATPAAVLLTHAYAMGFDPAARLFRSPR